MPTDPQEHDIAAELVLKALDGPKGPRVATAIVHTWLCGGSEGVPQEQVEAIVNRWPYRSAVTNLLGQVERLSLLEHLRFLEKGMNPIDQARNLVSLKGRQMLILDQVREYLLATIHDPNARQTLNLETPKRSDS